MLDEAAKPHIIGGRDYRVFWNHVGHVDDPEHPEDKNWAASEPDPDAP